MLETFVCALCGTVHPIADRIIFDGREICQDCCEERTVVCDRCRERIWVEDDCGDATHILCQHCEEQYYQRCADCGRLVAYADLRYIDDSDDGYCENCYSRHIREHGIQSYCLL